MSPKKKYIFLTFFISLSLIFLMGICFLNTPKSKVIRAFHKTFLSSQSAFCVVEPMSLLQAESISIDSLFTLNQLEFPLLPPKLSSNISLIEGISLKSTTNYFRFRQKASSNHTLSYLYKSYLQAFIYADQNTLFFQVPDLLVYPFSLQTTTLGNDFNASIFSDLLHHQFPKDYGFSLFPSFPVENITLKDITVQKTAGTYLVKLSDFPPITLTLDTKNRISGIDFTYSNFICHFTLEHNKINGVITKQDSLKNPLYHLKFNGTYRKQDTLSKASLQLSSVDILDEKGTFHLNLYGSLILRDAAPMDDLPDGKVYELFHLTKSDLIELSTELMSNLLTSELQPFLPYFR